MDLRAPASPGQYLLRDDFDAGLATNRRGLPCGEFELPVVLQDRIFSKSGRNLLMTPGERYDVGRQSFNCLRCIFGSRQPSLG